VFPDLVPVLAGRLPSDLVLDGELIAWDRVAGRLDFPALEARMTAGRRIRSVAAQRPAQFVAFDVLASGGQNLPGRPLRQRRRILQQARRGGVI
jgi:ATP-dependent DNA ligase